MAHSPAWTEEEISRLRELWDEGHSTLEIGRRLHKTKNQIIGKAHRLDLPARPCPVKRDPLANPADPRALRRTQTLPDLRNVNGTFRRHKPAHRHEAKREPYKRIEACCWPIGEPGKPGFRFCEAKSAPGKPYCADHVKIAYVSVAA